MNSKKIIASIISMFMIFSFGQVNAETSNASSVGVDHFTAEFTPDTAKVGELIDLKITAVDKNDNLIADFEGSVLIFSKSDPEVELPISLDNNTYTFTAADQGEVKFENGIGFSKKGVQDLYVYDFQDDEIFGLAQIEITEGEAASKIPIDILSPELGLTIPDNEIKVSGSTNKNHQVVVKVNDKEYKTISNSNGIYEIEATDLISGENIIIASVLDADGNIAGTSTEVKIRVDNSGIILKNVKLIPDETFTNSIYEIEAVATPNLTEVKITLNDEIITLSETDEGLYTGKGYAPDKPGNYNADIDLQDELGHKLKEMGVATLKVKELNSGNDKQEEKKEENTDIDIEQQVGNLDPLTITGLKLVKLKTKSILTWNELDTAEGYNIYKKNDEGIFEFIATVKNSKFEVEIDEEKEISYDYFAVRAIGKTPAGEKYEGDLSEATKIQTGPEMLIILILSILMGIGFLGFIKFRKKA